MNKTPYIKPTVKVVDFRVERGYDASCFTRNTSGDLFEMDLIDGAARGERFAVDNWDASPSSTQDGRFNLNDWGTM